MKPGVNPKVDFAFKRLFGRDGNQPVLRHMLHAVLQPRPAEQIVDLELLNPFNDKETLDDKLSILDIKARDQSGRLFNIEMQLLAYGAFRKRALYYWAKLYQGQLLEGMDFRDLRPTYTICFVDTVLFPGVPAYHLAFDLRERQHQVAFTDDLALHILELPKFTRKAHELTTPLDVWLYFLRHGETLDTDALPPALNLPEIHRALGELYMMTQSDLERERYEARLKLQRDIHTAKAEARDEGRAEGLKEGRDEGLKEGRAEGLRESQVEHIHFCQRLLQCGLTPKDQLLALPLADLGRLVAELEADVTQLLARPS
jgi:predicted transposase/invertase (TIGR01784 family)